MNEVPQGRMRAFADSQISPHAFREAINCHCVVWKSRMTISHQTQEAE
jgi:hypothetical protein